MNYISQKISSLFSKIAKYISVKGMRKPKENSCLLYFLKHSERNEIEFVWPRTLLNLKEISKNDLLFIITL